MKYFFYTFFIFFLLYQNNKIIFKNLLYLLGFKIDLDSLNNLPSKVILINTHTSIYDFFIGMFIYYSYLHDKYDNYILMKEYYEKYTNLFFKYFDKKLKLIKVEKEKNGLTNKIIDQLKYKDNYLLYISPEGTRYYTEKLKTGYWVLSKELNLDICYIGIDFYNKLIKFEEVRKPEKYWDDEVKKFEDSSIKYAPLFPENCFFYK